MEKPILGHIDCPTCGTAKGMRIKPDRNGDPFGYCEAECGQQLRIGGDPRRVRDFVRRYPWAGKPAPEPVTAPASPAPPAPLQEKIPVTVTELQGQATHHGPVKKRSALEDALVMLGGKKK